LQPSAAPPDRRRILLLSERADLYGGGQQSLVDLATLLARGPFAPLVALPGPGPLAAALETAGVPVRVLPLPPVVAARGRRAAQAIWALATLARREGAGVLHSDSPRTALYAGLASRLAGRAHLWHVRASITSSALADRLLVGMCDRVVAVSRAAAARSAPLSRCARLEIVHTGLQPPVFLDRRRARETLGLPQDRVIAGVIGRVEPDKGGEDAIAALAAMRAVAPGAMLAFLGTAMSGAAWPATLRGRAAAAGLESDVLFLGHRPEAAGLLRGFDLVLHPSRHEALPRTLIEALYAGVPAAAYAVGGIPEIIEHGHTGLLATPRDVAGFAAAAAALTGDPARRAALGRAGRLQAAGRFSLEAMGRAMNRIYAGLAGLPPAPAVEAVG
jgi:glycosyltransferase involved in cell wall biosynthesis